MADSELRRLEREFRARGTAEAEAAWLRARVKSGDLLQERLDLAAYCGHAGACAAVATARALPSDLDAVVAFARGLEPFGREAQVRAALAAVAGLPELRPGTEAQVQACLAAVAEWLTDPSEENAAEAFRAGRSVADHCGHAFDVYRMFSWTPCGPEAVGRLMQWPEPRVEPLASCLAQCWHHLGTSVVGAVTGELSTWALGY